MSTEMIHTAGTIRKELIKHNTLPLITKYSDMKFYFYFYFFYSGSLLNASMCASVKITRILLPIFFSLQ